MPDHFHLHILKVYGSIFSILICFIALHFRGQSPKLDFFVFTFSCWNPFKKEVCLPFDFDCSVMLHLGDSRVTTDL